MKGNRDDTTIFASPDVLEAEQHRNKKVHHRRHQSSSKASDVDFNANSKYYYSLPRYIYILRRRVENRLVLFHQKIMAMTQSSPSSSNHNLIYYYFARSILILTNSNIWPSGDFIIGNKYMQRLFIFILDLVVFLHLLLFGLVQVDGGQSCGACSSSLPSSSSLSSSSSSSSSSSLSPSPLWPFSIIYAIEILLIFLGIYKPNLFLSSKNKTDIRNQIKKKDIRKSSSFSPSTSTIDIIASFFLLFLPIILILVPNTSNNCELIETSSITANIITPSSSYSSISRCLCSIELLCLTYRCWVRILRFSSMDSSTMSANADNNKSITSVDNVLANNVADDEDEYFVGGDGVGDVQQQSFLARFMNHVYFLKFRNLVKKTISSWRTPNLFFHSRSSFVEFRVMIESLKISLLVTLAAGSFLLLMAYVFGLIVITIINATTNASESSSSPLKTTIDASPVMNPIGSSSTSSSSDLLVVYRNDCIFPSLASGENSGWCLNEYFGNMLTKTTFSLLINFAASSSRGGSWSEHITRPIMKLSSWYNNNDDSWSGVVVIPLIIFVLFGFIGIIKGVIFAVNYEIARRSKKVIQTLSLFF
jgi:hypothetical protein